MREIPIKFLLEEIHSNSLHFNSLNGKREEVEVDGKEVEM